MPPACASTAGTTSPTVPCPPAAAACKLLGLDPTRTRHALGIAGVCNVALRQTRAGELSMWKGCAFANAARNGVFAALLAAEGLTGPAPIFEGDLGFMKLLTGTVRAGTPGRRPVAETDFMIDRDVHQVLAGRVPFAERH